MSTCYLCGSINHSYDCPKYIRIAFVQEPPTIKEKIVTFKLPHDDQIWRIDIVVPTNIIPLWVTHGWFLTNRLDTWEGPVSNSKLSLKTLADNWSVVPKGKYPWTITYRTDGVGKTYGVPQSDILTVFAKI